MNSAVDIMRINFKSKDRSKGSFGSTSPISKFRRNQRKSKSKSRSKKYIINHDVKNFKRKKEDYKAKGTRGKKKSDLYNLEKLLRETRLGMREPLGLKSDFSNIQQKLKYKNDKSTKRSKVKKRNRTRSPFDAVKRSKRKTKSPSYINLKRPAEIEYVCKPNQITKDIFH